MIEAFIRRPGGVVALGALGALAVCALAWPFTVDDAFIGARFAQNLASGRGYGMNPDVPADGLTGPLWIVPPLLAVWIGADPLVITKLAGAFCACAAVVLTIVWARRRALGGRAAWATACVLACLPDVGTWAISGLETGAALLAVTGLAFALLAPPGPRFAPALAATLALAWLRPELAPCVLVLWLAPALREPRRAAPWLAAAALAAASVIAWRAAMFGHALPLSASAKPADLAHGSAYALRAVLLMTSGGVGVLLLATLRKTRREDRWLLGALSAHLVAVAVAGGDWMPGARLIVPVAGLYALLIGRAVTQLALKRSLAGWLGLAVALVVPLGDLVVRVPELARNAEQRERAAALAELLERKGQTVALLDAGYLPYASGVAVVDLGGLTDAEIARLPGGHIDKKIDDAYLRARAPGVILLHSEQRPEVAADGRLLAFSGYPVEHRVAAMPWVRHNFRVTSYAELNASYGYVVLERALGAVR